MMKIFKGILVVIATLALAYGFLYINSSLDILKDEIVTLRQQQENMGLEFYNLQGESIGRDMVIFDTLVLLMKINCNIEDRICKLEKKQNCRQKLVQCFSKFRE